MSTSTTQSKLNFSANVPSKRENKKRKLDPQEKDQHELQNKKIKVTDPHLSSKKTKVVKIKRQNGQIVQDCDVYIGRAINMGGWRLKGSKWANPFKVKDVKSNKSAVELYRDYLMKNDALLKDLHELKGKVLGCWCKPAPCHGDVLVELANNLDTNTSNNEKKEPE